MRFILKLIGFGMILWTLTTMLAWVLVMLFVFTATFLGYYISNKVCTFLLFASLGLGALVFLVWIVHLALQAHQGFKLATNSEVLKELNKDIR